KGALSSSLLAQISNTMVEWRIFEAGKASADRFNRANDKLTFVNTGAGVKYSGEPSAEEWIQYVQAECVTRGIDAINIGEVKDYRADDPANATFVSLTNPFLKPKTTDIPKASKKMD